DRRLDPRAHLIAASGHARGIGAVVSVAVLRVRRARANGRATDSADGSADRSPLPGPPTDGADRRSERGPTDGADPGADDRPNSRVRAGIESRLLLRLHLT